MLFIVIINLFLIFNKLNINPHFYLTLSIRRDYLIEDTLKELSKPNITIILFIFSLMILNNLFYKIN